MVQIIGLIIAVYTFTRLVSFATRTGDRKEHLVVQVLALVGATATILLTIVLVYNPDTDSRPPSLGSTGTSPAQAYKDDSIELKVDAQLSSKDDSFRLQNKDEFDWSNVWIALNPEKDKEFCKFNLSRIPAGQTYTVLYQEFKTNNGARFDVQNPKNFEPLTIAVRAECDAGVGYGQVQVHR